MKDDAAMIGDPVPYSDETGKITLPSSPVDGSLFDEIEN
jgi:hypothetical protein